VKLIYAKNVNEAIVEGIWWLRVAGSHEKSRNGEVLVSDGPVITEYACPEERVLFLPERDANPIFHLVEALWMLAGREDVASLLPYNARMAEYAESDGYIHGAYGARWLQGDQIWEIVTMLKLDPGSRRAVLQMWDYRRDLATEARDLPCNTHAYFDCRQGVLNMTVCCRSNDMLWGAYGANAVHFSILQEVIARAVGVPIGRYRQMSNNFHVYVDNDVTKRLWYSPPMGFEDPYAKAVKALPLITDSEVATDFVLDCENFFEGATEFHTRFMSDVAYPLAAAYLSRKNTGHWNIDDVPACDWKQAFIEWTERRMA
jgi:hypothetical protein